MKTKLILISLGWIFVNSVITTSFAAPLSMEIRSERIPVVAEAVLKGVIGTDYAIAPEVLADDRLITFSVKNVEPQQAVQSFQAVLQAAGIKMEKQSGLFLLTKTQPKPEAVEQGGALPGSSANPLPADQPAKPNPQGEYFTYIPKYQPSDLFRPVLTFAGATVPDQKNSSILIYQATEDQNQKILPLLQKLDTKPESLTIRAAVIEYTDTQDESRSFAGVLNLLTGKLGISIASGQKLANAITFTGTDLNAVLSATSGDSRFNYLAQPVLRVLNGNKANITVGSDVPTRGDSTTDKNGNINNSITYQTAGLILDITPTIYADFIQLAVDQQVSSFSKNDTSNIDSPTKIKRRATSVLDIKRGELIVMAGLDEDKTNDSRGGLSFLPDFLRSKAFSSSKSRILLLLEVI